MCFDWLFNRQVPLSNDVFVVAGPASKTWVNGIAQTYSEDYDHVRMGPHIPRNEYCMIMERLNDILINYFPCPLCWYCGYFCCLFTVGLSLLCPLICISDAETQMRQFISNVNRNKLRAKNMRLVLRKKCGTSWLEWHLPADIREEGEKEGGAKVRDTALLC